VPLTPRQMRFIHEYTKDFNGTKAAIRAGYSRLTADSQASRLLKKPKVRREIDANVERLALAGDVKPGDVLRELVAMANTDIRLAFDAEGRLLPLHELPADIRRMISSVEARGGPRALHARPAGLRALVRSRGASPAPSSSTRRGRAVAARGAHRDRRARCEGQGDERGHSGGRLVGPRHRQVGAGGVAHALGAGDARGRARRRHREHRHAAAQKTWPEVAKWHRLALDKELFVCTATALTRSTRSTRRLGASTRSVEREQHRSLRRPPQPGQAHPRHLRRGLWHRRQGVGGDRGRAHRRGHGDSLGRLREPHRGDGPLPRVLPQEPAPVEDAAD
jgi:hypothetical protein